MMTLAFVMIAAASAFAGPEVPASELEDIRSDFNAHFFPERLAGEPSASLDGDRHSLSHAQGFSCLTGLVMRIKANWTQFTAEERAEMTAVLTPWKRDLMDPDGSVPTDGAMPPPDGPCNGYEFDDYVDGQYHSIQWEAGTITANRAQDLLDAFEESFEIEVVEQGWRAPNRITSYPMPVYVVEGRYGGAYTSVTNCGASWQPYVVAYAGGLSGGTWYKTLACHEFNHASQFSYGQAHEFWWWEATATFAEEYVYESYDEWVNFVDLYGDSPHIGLNASAGGSDDQTLFYHTYAMAIWAFYLDEYHGGYSTILDLWELAADRARSTSGYDYWMPDAVDDLGLDFDDVWTGFMAVNAVMDYSDRDLFPWAERTEEVDELPASGEDSSRLQPQSLGMAFVTFDDDVGGDGDLLEVEFNGKDGPEWYAVLVRGDTSVEELVVFDIDQSNGRGTASIVLADGADVHLVVSPVDEDAQGYRYDWSDADDWAFEWEAQLVEADPEDADDDESSSGMLGCGCQSRGVGAALAWLALFPALVLVARRQ